MMGQYYIYYDSGTTNTRIYLFRDQKLLDQSSEKVGSREVAINGNNQIYLQKLNDMWQNICLKNHLSTEMIDQIWMSGMVSSPTGIIEVPHLCVPINIEDLKKNVRKFYEGQYFHRELFLIPGIKTMCEGKISLDTVYQINNMRGEETELAGILAEKKKIRSNCAIIMPGSHTQIAFIKDDKIADILSTVTGELYYAIKSDTILKTSLIAEKLEQLDVGMLCKGYEILNQYGFNRALYTVRTMELFMDSTPQQRLSYFEGILNGGVINIVIKKMLENKMQKVAVYGSSIYREICRILIQKYFPEIAFEGIKSEQEIPYSARGFLTISGIGSREN